MCGRGWRFVEPQVPGAIAPVPATPEMTQEVGIRNCRLYTKPGDAVVSEFEARLAAVEDLAADTSLAVDDLETAVEADGTQINSLQTRMTNAENRITALENGGGGGGGNCYQQVAGQFSIGEFEGHIVLSLTYNSIPDTAVIDSIDMVVKVAGGTVYRAFTLYHGFNNEYVVSENGSGNGYSVFTMASGSNMGLTIATFTQASNTLWSTNIATGDTLVRAIIKYHN